MFTGLWGKPTQARGASPIERQIICPYDQPHRISPLDACIAGPILGLTLYAVLRVFDGGRYTPLVFAAVFLPGVGAFSVWAWYFCEE
jgi:hypothetical protein